MATKREFEKKRKRQRKERREQIRRRRKQPAALASTPMPYTTKKARFLLTADSQSKRLIGKP